MPNRRRSSCCSALLACSLFLIAATGAPANQATTQISQTEIDQSVVSYLPKLNGERANIVARLDLTSPFNTQGHWAFVAAILPGSHTDGASDEPVQGGALARCFVHELRPLCTYTITTDGRVLDYSIPIKLYSVRVVFRGADKAGPLLMIATGGSHGGDGGHVVYTELFSYDRQSNEFTSVFSNATGSNNNQRTRFIEEGPLRGDVIVDEPAGCCYRINVYRLGASGRYTSILSYRSHTVYGDGNPLSVSDSEMPEILRRLGLWRKGDALPIPYEGCTPVMRRGEEWCQ